MSVAFVLSAALASLVFIHLTFSLSASLGVVCVGACVYAVGGFNGSLRVRTVDCYDPVADRWSCVSSMQDRRSTLGAAVLNGLLYAVGGFDGSTGGCGCGCGNRLFVCVRWLR